MNHLKLSLIIILLLITGTGFSIEQTEKSEGHTVQESGIPGRMSYQAIIRNAEGKVIVNQQVGVRISIIQGSDNGNVVYTENRITETNANGMVSLEIGSETGFEDINWSDGPYFIRIETDPSGGNSYTIAGSSELLSVPFAMHAKSAENVFSGNYNDLTNKPALFDGTWNSLSGKPICEIGDFAHGGIVFWVDESGQHGLVCAKNDQSDGTTWWAGTFTYTMARGDGPMAGMLNTAIIIANQGNGNGTQYAARICNETIITEGGKTYGDWYLPSAEELNMLYLNKNIINATAIANGGNALTGSIYWSSTESSNFNAYMIDFTSGTIYPGGSKNNLSVKVRAVRKF